MSILIHGLVLESLPPEFDGEYWRSLHSDPLLSWSVPVAITQGVAPERPVVASVVVPHEPEKPRCDTPEPGGFVVAALALVAMWWRLR